MQNVSLLSLATAVPPNVIEQQYAKALARDAFGGKKALFDRLSGVFDNAGIAKRHIVAPHEWYLSRHGWHDRNAIYLESSQQLFIEAELAQAVDEMCAKLGISRGDIDRFCCHPGGVKVIDAIETALDLNQGELNLEREVLHDFGNMSAPTVLFVLERLLKQGLPDRVLMTAFGPGFTCAGMLLEAA